MHCSLLPSMHCSLLPKCRYEVTSWFRLLPVYQDVPYPRIVSQINCSGREMIAVSIPEDRSCVGREALSGELGLLTAWQAETYLGSLGMVVPPAVTHSCWLVVGLAFSAHHLESLSMHKCRGYHNSQLWKEIFFPTHYFFERKNSFSLGCPQKLMYKGRVIIILTSCIKQLGICR